MIPFRTLCAKLRTTIKGLAQEERATLGVLPKCIHGGASYSYRVDAGEFLRLCARAGLCPLTGHRLATLRDPGVFCTASLGAGCAVKRGIEKLSQRAAADVIGISASTVNRLEQNLPVSIESALAVCEFIGVHPFGYLRHERKPETTAPVKRAA